MRSTNMKSTICNTHLVLALAMAVALLFTASANAATPGITGPTFNLTAQDSYITQPDGRSVYSWGYGCNGAPSGFAPSGSFGPGKVGIVGANCPSMQIPGPTLIVTEGDSVSITLTNNLPPAAGNTSILFPGFNVTTSGGVAGLLTQEAAHGSTVTYTFTATTP